VRITAVDVLRIRIPLARPYVISRGRIEAFTNLLIRVHGSEGVVGLGECALLSLLGDLDAAERLLREMGRRLVGMDSWDVETVIAAIEPGLSFELGPLAAIDMALWDLNGKESQLPAYVLLGGLIRRRMLVDFTIGQNSPDVMATQAAAMARAGGFTGFCVKVGGRSSAIELDIARVRAVRERLGPTVKIRVDANGGFSLHDARTFMRGVEPFGVEFVEQPLPPDDLDGLRRLANMTEIPISVDEGLQRPSDAMRLADMRAVAVFNIKIPKCGGLFLSKQIAAIAQAAGIRAICGGGLAFEVIRQASRHFTASTPLGGHDLHHEGPGPASQGLAGDVSARVIDHRDVRRWNGHVAVTDDPGLGVIEDRAAVEEFSVA